LSAFVTISIFPSFFAHKVWFPGDQNKDFAVASDSGALYFPPYHTGEETMSTTRFLPGEIAWSDLTIKDAGTVRDFYRRVVGWKAENVSMGEYNDFGMIPPGRSKMVTGICHSRGTNADLPPVWLMYLVVKNLDRSLQSCLSLSGSIVAQPRPLGRGRMCVIQDPAGAMVALYELPPDRTGGKKRSGRRPGRS
jgi:uncharacterized protein